MTPSPFSPQLAHFGISVRDIDLMTRFYTQVFDLRVNDDGVGNTFRFRLRFLSGRADMHHQLVLAENRPADATFSTVMQLSFKVGAIDHLRTVRTRALAAGATQMRGLNHGNALSIYFADPEGNTCEVYLDTPWYVPQPHGDPLDLDKSDAELWAETERIVRADPGFMPEAERAAKFAQTPGH